MVALEPLLLSHGVGRRYQRGKSVKEGQWGINIKYLTHLEKLSGYAQIRDGKRRWARERSKEETLL